MKKRFLVGWALVLICAIGVAAAAMQDPYKGCPMTSTFAVEMEGTVEQSGVTIPYIAVVRFDDGSRKIVTMEDRVPVGDRAQVIEFKSWAEGCALTTTTWGTRKK